MGFNDRFGYLKTQTQTVGLTRDKRFTQPLNRRLRKNGPVIGNPHAERAAVAFHLHELAVDRNKCVILDLSLRLDGIAEQIDENALEFKEISSHAQRLRRLLAVTRDGQAPFALDPHVRRELAFRERLFDQGRNFNPCISTVFFLRVASNLIDDQPDALDLPADTFCGTREFLGFGLRAL